MTKIAYDLNKNVHSMSKEHQKMTYFDRKKVNHLFFLPKKDVWIYFQSFC